MSKNIAIIGTGNVGTTTAYTLILQNLVQKLILVDINQTKCKGELLDLSDTLAFSSCAHIQMGSLEDARKADIIIITAGIAQKPRQSRRDLVATNKKIVSDIIKNLNPLSPETCIIVVTNPVDVLTTVAINLTTLPKHQIMGSSTWLDTQRLRRIVGNKIGIAPESLDLFVIGEHGDAQYVSWRNAPSIAEKFSEKEKADIEYSTRNTVQEIICAKGVTCYGVAACVADVCRAIIFDEKRIIPVSTYVHGYDVCFGTPALIGRNGVEKIIDFKPNAVEQEVLANAARIVKEML